MKTIILNLSKVILIVILFCFSESINAQFQSTATGGDWSIGTTWVGGSPPGPASDVVINGPVYVDGSLTCNNITINSSGTLMNKSGANRILTVDGDITNHGTIQNNYNVLTLNIYGNIIHDGDWLNWSTNLVSASDQEIFADSTFSGNSFNNTISSKNVNVIFNNLSFNNCSVDMGSCNVIFGNGDLTISNDYFKNAVIIAENLNMTLNSGAYLQDITCNANNVYLDGTVQVTNNVEFNGNITDLVVEVMGTLQNRSGANYTMDVNGSLHNSGVIQDNYNVFLLNISGNVVNNGVWSNYHTYIDGNSNQFFTFFEPFTGEHFTSLMDAGGVATATSALRFSGTVIEFNGDSLYMNAGYDSLFINGGRLQNMTILAGGPPWQVYFHQSGGTWFDNVNIEASDVVLDGIFQYMEFLNIYGNTRVGGTLQNQNGNNHTANIYGNLINNGTIQNNYFNSYLYITGNINQNGTWTNNQTYLSGDDDQVLDFTTPFNGASLTNSNINGKIISNSDLTFNSTIVDFNNDTLYFSSSGDSLIVNGDYFRNAVIMKEGSKTSGFLNLTQTSNAYFENVIVVADDINITGIVQFVNPMQFIGHVTVEGTLQNHNGNNRTATISGDVTNNGTIQNNYFNFYLHITGNINQNGGWTNNHTYLSGDNDQVLDFTTPFNGANLTNSNINGKIISNSSLTFNSTIIDFNNDTLLFASTGDSLIVNDDYFKNAVIIKEKSKTAFFLNLTQTLNAYFWNVIVVADDIDLTGIIQFINPMEFVGHVTVEGTLQNLNGNNRTATITGDVTNNGTIQNNYFNSYLHITGNIHQNGIWTNNHTYLSGDDDQVLDFTTPFNGANLTNSNINGKVLSNSDLTFNSTIIDFNNDTLIFASTGDSLIVNGDYFRNAVIMKDGSKTAGFLNLTQTLNAYFQNVIVEADEINITGTIQYINPMQFVGHVTVDGIFQNMNGGHRTATISGNLTNNGTIRNNTYNNDLYITGNIEQNGVWSNSYNYLSGSSSQNLYQTSEFTCYRITDTDPASSILGMSDLIFQNTDVDLGGATLQMKDYAILSVSDAWFNNADIVSNSFDLIMSGSSSLENISLDNVTIYDWVRVKGGCTFSGTTTVEGTLSNLNGAHYTLHIDGDIQNNGSIQNYSHSLYMNVDGDIFNNGNWANTWTQLNGYGGSVNQTIDIQNGQAITGQIKLFTNSASTYNWHWNGGSLYPHPDFTGELSQILNFSTPVSATWAGTFNCLTDIGWSRNIYVTTSSVAVPEVELNALLQGTYNGATMNTTLNTNGNLPLSQPYNNVPWNYWGNESVGDIPNTNVVDWVYVEFRDAVNATSAIKATTIDRQAAFVLNDGSVVGLDGTSSLYFSGTVVNNLYVAVYHRNHLGIMSATALTEASGVYNYSFTSGPGQAYGIDAQTNLDGGVYGMRGGDADGDGDVDGADFLVWQINAGTAPDYDMVDLNMDNQVDNLDKNDIWLENDGQSVQVPE